MNQKILFVDDEPSALNLYRQMLRDELEISTAVCGKDGIEMLRNLGPFAIVISDMKMPGMDGAQFLKNVRELAPNTIRLLISGQVDLDGAVNAVNEGGIFRLLMKPCEESVLRAAIAAALMCYHKRKEERVRIELPVSLSRSSPSLKVLLAHTVDISNGGTRLAGLEEQPEIGEVLKVEFGNRRAPFRVRWTGTQGTATAGQVGLECLAPNIDIWKFGASQLENVELLNRARVVQHGFLPKDKPQLRTLDYAGNCSQARMVGGDLYDFLDLGPGEVGLVLGDVSGKGVPAALFMASLLGSLRTQSQPGPIDIPQLLTALNLLLYKQSMQQRYVTLFFGRYNDATRSLQYVNCGHNPPLLLRNGDVVERLNATAMVLGLFSDWTCTVEEVQLEAGDVLGMYTDGITETTRENREQFSEARLLEMLRRNRHLEAEQILRKIEDAVDQFRLGEQEDDLTLVIACAR